MGVATIELYIHGVNSLKEKRSVVRRVVDRVRSRFGVSVAEVDSLDLHRKATIGLAVVSNDGRLADSVLNKVLNFVEDLHLAEITQADVEILHF